MNARQAWTLALSIGSFLVSGYLKAATCPASPTVMCLAGQRFAVEVRWKDFQGKTGQGQAVGLTPDTGYFWFFSDNNVELVVKILDARSFNNHFWVFFGALSNVEYTLKVTDTATGAIKSYQNPSGQFASVGDTAAFPGATAGVASTHETTNAEGTETAPGSLEAIQRFVEAVPAKSASEASKKKAEAFTPCPGPSTSLYLSNCRFELSVLWTTPQGQTGSGHAVQLTSDTGYFWFFSDNNVELIVKVLDARAFNDKFWVFYGALSNVQYTLHVKDTISGALHIYQNGSGSFASVGDTSAFRGGYGVTVSLDSARAVSSNIVAADGGTVSATAADGTVFTLDIPAGSLFSDKTITVTPVNSIARFPFSGGLTAAVDIQPSGLYLLGGARLTIKTSSPIPQAEETPFAWNGSGEDFFLYPPVAAKGDLRLSIFHLGGYGVGRGTDAERQTQAGREPVADDDRLSHNIAPLLRQGRAEAQSGRAVGILRVAKPQGWRSDLIASFDQVYTENGGLRDQMLGTTGDPDEVVYIILNVEDWKSAVIENFGSLENAFPGKDRLAEVRRLIEGMLRRALRIIHDRCSTDVGAITQLPRILNYVKTLGFELGQEVTDVYKCLSFQLTFESTVITVFAGGRLSFQHSVKAEVPLKFSAELFTSQGIGPIRHTDSRVTALPDHCQTTQLDFSGEAVFDATLFLPGDLEKNGSQIVLGYNPRIPPSKLTIQCEDDPAINYPNWWAGVYVYLHHDEFLGGTVTIPVLYVAKLSVAGGGTPFATRNYARAATPPYGVLNELTTIKIDHTPE